MNRKQIKAAAKAQIKGNIGMLFLITLVIGLVSCIPLVGTILMPAFSLSMVVIYLNLTYGQKPSVGDAFSGCKSVIAGWALMFLTALYTFLWSLLFYIPGIVKAISYSMAPYILMDNPGITVGEAIDESKRITKGHKWELFVLGLSFIGWILLICVTFGIAAIWVVPYMQAAYANAYNAIKAPQQAEATTSTVNAKDEDFLNSMF